MKIQAWLKKNREIIIFLVVVLILFGIIQMTLLDPKKRPKIKLIQGQGSIPPGWSPDGITHKLFEALDGIDSSMSMEVTFGQANMLNNNQLVAVWNRWDDVYFDKRIFFGFGPKFGSLLNALKDDYSSGPQGNTLVIRLEMLNLV